jgi:hypothetical protein
VDPVLRRLFRIGFTLGLIGGVVFALNKLLGGRRSGEVEPLPSVRPLGLEEWPPLHPDPDAHQIVSTTQLQPDPEAPTWVEPTDGVCPTSHPVKAKLSSKIFHLPGMTNYDRTKPDRCYRDGDTAEADGLRPAKR